MSYGDYPAGGQEYDTGQTFGGPASYMGPPGYGQPGSMPPTYRVLGIIAVIGSVLFNLILGLPAALIGRRYSNRVSPLWANGDVQAAVKASRTARAWLIASLGLDVVGVILLAVVVFQGTSPNFNTPSVVAASIKTQVQQRLSDSTGPDYDPGVTVTSVVCTPAGSNTDRCVITVSTGQTDTVTATISGNGTGYTTS